MMQAPIETQIVNSTEQVSISPHFILRRLHSLSGVFPIGFFLLEHMLSNFLILRGPAAYDRQIAFLQQLPLVTLMEIFFIALPLLYHALYGFYVLVTGESNLMGYPHRENWLYFLQRWTGVVTFFYVINHVWQTKIANVLYGADVSYARMAALMQEPVNFWIYVLGLTAAIFHFANGIWGALISWGITVGEASRRVAGWICTIFGLLLYSAGIAALICLVR
jgi:succinate dehydrogenase / fumarate reductase cytochrome b subunit